MADIPRDLHAHDGDGWVQCACGSRHWGLYGAAGLLLWRCEDGRTDVLLQHRAPFSHHGGTWGLPGGALASGETPLLGALREAAEEACVQPHGVRVWASATMHHPDWSYTTVIGEDIAAQTCGIGDGESLDVRWIPAATVPHLPLLPAFEAAWPTLRAYLRRIELVLDVANLIGSVPDGWWNDRAGATARFLESLPLEDGFDATPFIADLTRIWPEVTAVLEGPARQAAGQIPTAEGLRVVQAPGAGDDEIVAQACHGAERGSLVLAATSDRELANRLRPHTLQIVGSRTWRAARG
ncbi:MAG: NUDIX hydrolase [Bowdeniella nasicola]|nr:NUDIX hydrolase [Bowdeniella nasicola]